MKALVKTQKGKGFIEVQDKPRPKLPGEDWVLIKVKAAGVCGTDLHIWHDTYPYWPPVILGHEFSGCVAEVGSAVKGIKAGDRVVAEPHSLTCGVCELCRSGRSQVCSQKRSPGWGIDGAFADYVAMPYHLLHKIPDKLSYDIAAMAEPFAIAVHEVAERAGVECGDFVVISGSGPIGIIAAVVAKYCGASTVVMTGNDPSERVRFPAALQLGVDRVINVQREDAESIVMDMTNGRGADMVIEASGSASAIALSPRLIKRYGRICVIGIPDKENIEFPWKTCLYKVATVVFNWSSSYTAWDKALKLMSSTKYDLNKLITHRASINDWESVFRDLTERKGIKALFIPEGEE